MSATEALTQVQIQDSFGVITGSGKTQQTISSNSVILNQSQDEEDWSNEVFDWSYWSPDLCFVEQNETKALSLSLVVFTTTYN